MTASSATGVAAFSTGTDSPVSAASSTLRLRSSDEPHVGRHLVAGLQEHDVARDELGRGQRALAPAPDHDRIRRRHRAQRLDRLARPVLLHEADDGVEDDHAADDEAIEHLAGEDGERRGGEQDVDQRVPDLPQEDLRGPRCRRPGQRVRAVALETACCVLVRQPGARGLQPVEDALGRHGMPGSGPPGLVRSDHRRRVVSALDIVGLEIGRDWPKVCMKTDLPHRAVRRDSTGSPKERMYPPVRCVAGNRALAARLVCVGEEVANSGARSHPAGPADEARAVGDDDP